MTHPDHHNLASIVTFYTRHGHEIIPSKGAVIRPRRGVFALAQTSQNVLLVWPEFTKGVGELPGGGIEDGETIDQALEREWNEETGLDFSCLHGPLKEYHHVRGFFAEDMDEFWIYDQTFRLYDFVVSVTTGDKWRNPEGDLAGWEKIAKLRHERINRAHWLAIRTLIAAVDEPANEDVA